MGEILQKKYGALRKCLAFILSIVMVLSTMTFTVAVADDETSTDGYLTISNYELLVKTASGEWITPSSDTEVENGQEIRLYFDWAISDTNALSTFSVTFPVVNIAIDDYGSSDSQLDLYDTSGTLVGTYYVENGVFYITLNSTGISKGYLTGTDSYFEGVISATSTDENGKAEIGISGSATASYTLLVDLNIPTSSVSVSKSTGDVTVTDDGIYQTYTITAKASGDNTDVIIYDTTGSYINIVDGSISYSIDGGTETSASGFPISVGDLTDGQVVTITYTAKIADSVLKDNVYSSDEYSNTVYATYTNNEGTSSKTSEHVAKPSISNTPSISKSGSISDDNTTVTWTITVNLGDFENYLTNISISDTLGSYLTLDDSSLDLSSLTLADFTKNANGTYTLTYTTTVDSTIAASSSSTSLTNDADLNYTYDGNSYTTSTSSSVSTSVASMISKTGSYVYDEQLGYYIFTWTVTINVPDEGLTSLTLTDRLAGALSHSLLIDDGFTVSSSSGTTSITGFVDNGWGGYNTVTTGGISTEPMYGLSGYTMTFDSNYLSALTAGSTISITYNTYSTSTIVFDESQSVIYVDGTAYTPSDFAFRNGADISYTTPSSTQTGSDSVTIHLYPCEDWTEALTKVFDTSTNSVLANAFSSDYGITTIGDTSSIWALFIDFSELNSYEVGDVITITDTLPAGMTLHYNSEYKDCVIIDTTYRAIYYGSTWDPGTYLTSVNTYDALREALEVNVSSDGQTETVTFTITITDAVIGYVESCSTGYTQSSSAARGLYIAYVTDITDEAAYAISTSTTYTNSATSTYNGYPAGYDTASATLTPETLLTKSGSWDSSNAQGASYEIYVNEGAYSLTTSGGYIEVVDTLGAALQYDISTIVVYEYKNGTWETLDSTKYSYALSTTTNTDDTLTFTLPDGKYLKITYDVYITESVNGTSISDDDATNSVSISGYGSSDTTSSSVNILSEVTGGVTANAELSSIKLIKYTTVNGTSVKYLDGAVFTLTPVYYDTATGTYNEYSDAEIANNSNLAAQTVTVSSSGTLIEDLLFNQIYRLSETKAPDGYDTADDIYFYIPNAVDGFVPTIDMGTEVVEYSNLVVNAVNIEDDEITPSPTPVTETPTPVTETPTPMTETPTPVTETPTPVTETPTPVTETPTPITETPTPVTETPVPTATDTPTPTPLTTKISIKKTDGEGNAIEGVTFGIYSDKDCTTAIDILTTDSNGEATSTNDYEAGTYYLKEISAPDEYVKLSKDVYAITLDDKTTYVSISIDGDDQVSIENQVIVVVNLTVTPTNTATETPTPVTETPTPVTETPVPSATDTPVPSATDTPVPTATDTPVPTATDTPVPTATDTPTATPTDTPTATPTDVPTATPTDVPTATPTDVPTATPTDTPTATPTDVPTATPTDVPTATPTDVPTATPTDTPTATPTDVPTATPTDVPTATPTDVPTATPTDVPTATPTDVPTATPTDVPTATPTDVPTATPTPTTSVKISKVDIANGEEVEGATLQILDASGNVVAEWVSTDTLQEITGLETGVEYTLRETVAPTGYEIATDTTFVLDENGEIDTSKTTTTVSDTGVLLVEDTASPTATSTPTPTPVSEADSNLIVEVLDEDTGEPVEGAVVRITDAYGNSVDLVTGKDGKVFGDFEIGDYTIEVVSVPDGYTVTTGQTTSVTLVENETAEHQAKIAKLDGAQLGDSDSGTLPITGMLVWPISLLSILGALFTVGGVIDNRRRRTK